MACTQPKAGLNLEGSRASQSRSSYLDDVISVERSYILGSTPTQKRPQKGAQNGFGFLGTCRLLLARSTYSHSSKLYLYSCVTRFTRSRTHICANVTEMRILIIKSAAKHVCPIYIGKIKVRNKVQFIYTFIGAKSLHLIMQYM